MDGAGSHYLQQTNAGIEKQTLHVLIYKWELSNENLDRGRRRTYNDWGLFCWDSGLRHHILLICKIFLETGSLCVAQAGLKLLGSSDPVTSDSRKLGSHYVNQAGFKLLASSDPPILASQSGFAAAVTTPLDVAKTRIMLAKAGSSTASGNVLSALHGVWRSQGLAG
ncbi:S-adenosylmethionine mitochondrial carrier protein [Plecturocebus cupreus]